MLKVTPANLAKLDSYSERDRKRLLIELGDHEFARCADDPIYWMDGRQRGGYHYVYTWDNHPQFKCNICGDTTEQTHSFNKLHTHLQMRHELGVLKAADVRHHFSELSAIQGFPMKDYMPPIIEYWMQEPLMLIEKSRDMMATWLIVILYTWDTIFHQGRHNVFQSEKAPKTAELVRRAYHVWKHQPWWLKKHKFIYTVGGEKAGVLRCESLNSEIMGIAQGSEQIRQYHPSGMFTDETAFHKDAAATFGAVKPAIQSGGKYTGVSTANPGWFHQAVMDLY